MERFEASPPSYRALESDEIRLVTLRLPEIREACNSDTPIALDLSYSTLENASFDALSYTWGEESDGSKVIKLDGKEINIGVNLFNFLLVYRQAMIERRDNQIKENDDVEIMLELTEGNNMLQMFGLAHLRQERDSEIKKRADNPSAWQRNIPIWIDAICINQRDLSEKNVQIPQMTEIYSKADAVIVWLGEADETSERAMRFLHKMILNRGLDMVRMVLPQVRKPDTSSESTIAGLNMTTVTAKGTQYSEWADVAKLFNRSYWHRMWVVQEMVCSTYAQLWCGNRILGAAAVKRVQRDHWGDLLMDAGVRSYLDPRCPQPYSIDTPVEVSLIQGGTWPLDVINQTLKSDNQSLRAVMSLIRLRKATNPKDMIYSLVGMLPSSEDHKIPVEYADTYPTAKTFADFMRYEIGRSKSLSIWQLLTERESPIEGLPSWIVDWVNQEPLHECIKLTSYVKQPETGEDLFVRSQDIVQAAADTTAVVRFLEVHSTMAVSGFLIGTVDAIGSKVVQKPDDSDDAFHKDFGSLNDFLGEVCPEAGVLTLIQIGCCLALDSYDTILTRNDGQIRQADVDALKTVVAAGPLLAIPHRQLLLTMLHRLLEAGFNTQRPDLIAPSIKRKFWDRRWIMNKKFSSFGSAPARTLKADVLFVPRGCPLVMVLRAMPENKYKVIGPCWLNGFMHGEAVKLWHDGTVEERELILQ